MRIRHKLLLGACLLMLLLLTALWLALRAQLALPLQQQADTLGSTLVAQTADSITELVLANDQVSLNVVLGQLADSQGIAQVTVRDVDGREIAAAGSSPPPPVGDGARGVYSAQITLQDSIAGTVRMTLDPALAGSALDRIGLTFWVVLGLGLLLTAAAALALGNHLAAPLEHLLTALSGAGDEPVEEARRDDEIGWLQDACGDLLARCQAAESALRERPAPPAPHAGLRLQASVLSLQVANLNTAIELLHPSTLSRLIEEYQRGLRQAVEEFDGLLQGNSGAAATLVFDQRRDSEHARRAIRCARHFLRRMREINAAHREAGSPVLQFRLAVHSGELFLTALPEGEEIAERAMGQALETVAWLCGNGDDDRILVSAEAWARAGDGQGLHSLGQRELARGADNTALIAYILDAGSNQQQQTNQ